ncbi:uncharacterized protein BJ171DRAFT_100033 [Polychytrium aggregatum]|uniref:uncharacterized protein n=1 Tax=Polychytrium aggregatum TaxID=110093 RepID=UPI0022FF0B29|nr:uncharacterized protein BJ171DRAFT_100033 [Polychytrium aggregatum]KAI9204702.1 hypothetical protein BJ171DRAFT_100033 [Polychytrium aggregatum]
MSRRSERTPAPSSVLEQPSYVSIGTPQPQDLSQVRAKDRNSYQPLWKQEVRDEQGRKRFHGAFTGGFSAGHFNTVGSKEGWQPKQFVTSRSSRTNVGRQSKEDFMDEEDLEEFTGGRGNLALSEQYGSAEREALKRKAITAGIVSESEGGTLALSSSVVEDLIGPTADPIGIKLLRQMGWREGQGIGARVSFKRKAHGSRDTYEDDIHATGHSFAPTDTALLVVKQKTDVFGIGFDPLKNAPEFSRSHGSGRPGASGPQDDGKRFMGIKGSMGVGVLDDDGDDEDVYGVRSKSEYHADLGDHDLVARFHDQETTEVPQPRTRITQHVSAKIGGAFGRTHCRDGRVPPDGFVLGADGDLDEEWFSPPSVPDDFNEQHIFAADKDSDRPRVPDDDRRPKQLSADDRRDILGEEALKGPSRSVFSYMSIQQQDKLTDFLSQVSRTKDGSVEEVSGAPKVEKDVALMALKGFIPFANEPEKQARYKRFLEFKAGLQTEIIPCPASFTRNEAEHEIREFSKAALIYKPMSSMMSSRFVSSSDGGLGSGASDSKPTKTRNYGAETRSKATWYPKRLLCKRFNVAAPHPDRADQDESGRPDEDKSILNKKTMEKLLQAADKSRSEARISKLESHTDTARPSLSSPPAEAVTPEQGVMNDLNVERPPMDIFKAIFDDSDSDNSDDETGPTTRSAELQLPAPRPSVQSTTADKAREEETVPLPPPTFRPLFTKKKTDSGGEPALGKSADAKKRLSSTAKGSLRIASIAEWDEEPVVDKKKLKLHFSGSGHASGSSASAPAPDTTPEPPTVQSIPTMPQTTAAAHQAVETIQETSGKPQVVPHAASRRAPGDVPDKPHSLSGEQAATQTQPDEASAGSRARHGKVASDGASDDSGSSESESGGRNDGDAKKRKRSSSKKEKSKKKKDKKDKKKDEKRSPSKSRHRDRDRERDSSSKKSKHRSQRYGRHADSNDESEEEDYRRFAESLGRTVAPESSQSSKREREADRPQSEAAPTPKYARVNRPSAADFM